MSSCATLIQRTKRAFIVVRAWLYVRLRREVAVKTCLTGKCWCAGAEQCFFPRCTNCDSCIGADGQTLDPTWAEEWNRCPDCGGPL